MVVYLFLIRKVSSVIYGILDSSYYDVCVLC